MLLGDPNYDAFLVSFPQLERLGGMGGVVMFPAGTAEIVNRLRSSYPQNSPMWQDTSGIGIDDRVLVRMRLPLGSGREYYIVHTDGGSGDPAMYLLDGESPEASEWAMGEVLAILPSGEIWQYQRYNSIYPRRKPMRFLAGRLVEIDSTHSLIDLRTTALAPFKLRRGPEDSTVVAEIAIGDSLVVVEGYDPAGPYGALLYVRTSAGIEGWVLVNGPQCNFGLIKGICFLGD